MQDERKTAFAEKTNAMEVKNQPMSWRGIYIGETKGGRVVAV